MGVVLLPVKDPRRAKQRLSGLLSPEERYQLAWAMLSDVVSAVRGAKCVSAVFVVTCSPQVQAFARSQGFQVLIEQHQQSESSSVDWGSSLLKKQGVVEVLRLPGDLPLVKSRDIDKIFEAARAERGSVIVPSRDGTGTNALLRIPPDCFPSRFGPGSFRLHLNEAAKNGIRLCTVKNARIAVDVDEPDDLLVFLEQSSSGQTRQLLTSIDLRSRLHNAPA